MSKISKVLVTILLVIIFIVLTAIINGAAADAGRTPGFLGLIVFGGLIGGLKAIWKSDKSNEKQDSDDSNSSILQK